MQEIHVVGAAIRKGNKILVAQRSAHMNSPLKWEFVGGKVEQGETHQQALEREVNEELGVKIKVHGHIAAGQSDVKDKRIILHVYEAELLDGEPVAREHSQLQWVETGQLRMLDWAEADIPAVETLCQGCQGDGSRDTL